MFYLTQLYQVLTFQHVINVKVINELFYILFAVQNQGVFYTYSTAQSRPATFQRPSGHMQTHSTTQDSTAERLCCLSKDSSWEKVELLSGDVMMLTLSRDLVEYFKPPLKHRSE